MSQRQIPAQMRDAARAGRRRDLAMLQIVVLLAACSGIDAVRPHRPITDPALLFMAVTVDHPAINLSTAAPHNTIQLTVTARNGLGEPLAGLPAPTFRSTDSISVRVSDEGLVEAREAVSGVLVIAEITADGNVRHADTSVVNVTPDDTPPVLTVFSIQPEPPASAIWSAPGGFLSRTLANFAGLWAPEAVVARALDENGDPIPDLAIEYRSLDTAIVRFDDVPGAPPEPVRPGEAAIVATTTAYGVSMADTLMVTVTMPEFQDVLADDDLQPGQLSWSPAEVRVRTNGVVLWGNTSDELMTVTFDDPGDVEEYTELCAALGPIFGPEPVCGSGSIAAVVTTGTEPLGIGVAVRRFPVAGVYTYRSTTTGAVGRVIVADDLSADP